MKYALRLYACVLSLLVAGTHLGLAVDLNQPIHEVRIQGNQRSDLETIQYYIQTKPGDAFSSKKIREDIRRLYGLEYFDDIQIDAAETPEGLVVTFLLKEKPFVRNINVVGLVQFESFEFKEKIKTKRGSFFQGHYVPEDIRIIKQMYQDKGYYFTQVKPKFYDVENNQIDVEFQVEEGDKIKITQINFVGNKNFTSRKLRGVIQTSTQDIISILTDSGTYRKDILKVDVLKLETFYNDNGFLRVRVFDPRVEVDKERRKIYVTYYLEEGERYQVGSIDVKGDNIYKEADIRKIITLKPKETFSRSRFRENLFEVSNLYSKKGYAFVNVIPHTTINDQTRTVDIKMEVEPGRKVYLGTVTITGNHKTRDKVVRREIRIQEGEVFNSEKIQRSRQRINNLTFFDQVLLEQKTRREEDLIDLNVQVAERSTGSISAGAGYSNVEKIIFQAQISQGNLFGRGQRLGFTAAFSTLRTDFNLHFTEPWLFDREVSLGADVFNRNQDFLSFDSHTTGGKVRLGKAVGEYTSLSLGLRYEAVDIKVQDRETITTFLREQEGETTTASISPSYLRDTRNDVLSPSAGHRVQLSTEVGAHAFGGDNDFYKLLGEGTYYHPLIFKLVGMIHSKIGLVEGFQGDTVPITERFFIGGEDSLRGFSFNDVGPSDERGDSLGGEAMLVFNVELSYPFSRYLRGVVFYDRGQVYGSEGNLFRTTKNRFDLGEMRHSLGVGGFFYSPFGPISFAWGFKLDKEPGETPSQFHFSIGQAF